MRVLGITASPRERGNSDLLLHKAMAGAESGGAEVEYVGLRDMSLSGCSECNLCQETGTCHVDDDFQGILDRLLEADRLILATPVFFMAVCAQAKAMIDRCQCLWSRKYVVGQSLFPDEARDRRAMVIAVGGTKAKKMFDCVRLTMKYWLDVLEMTPASNLFVNQVDEKGAVLKHAEALGQAHRLGEQLAGEQDPPERPVTVELFGGLGT
jgi:multimeric flavodoxin WrbA